MKSSALMVLAAAIVAAACSNGSSGGGASSVNAGSLPGQGAPGATVAPPGTDPSAANAAMAPTGALPSSQPALGAPAAGSSTAGGPSSVSGMQGTQAVGGGGAAAMNPAGMAAAPAADPPGTVTLTMDSFMLQPNQEIYKCQNFDNPFGGKETAIQHLSTDMSPGSHHLHVYHMTTSATRTLEDCTIADFHPLMFGAATPHAEITYPAGMATKLLAASGVRIQVHYLNTKNEALKVQAVLKLSPVDESTITKWVSELYFSRAALQVMPGDGQTVSTTCTIPNTYGPIGLVAGGSHMHSRGVRFVAKTSTGVTLLDTTQWDEPPTVMYDPPVMLQPGDSINWTCTYNNDTGMTLNFGESALTNEMCIYLARFFSAPDGAQLECQAGGDTGMTSTRTY